MGGELQESKSFYSFIRDPQNNLGIQWNELSHNPCLLKLNGVMCNRPQASSIVEMRLENINLSGVMDADSLCKLRKVEVVSLSRNLIHGTIPSTILYCTRLSYLNLCSNSLSGRVPQILSKLKYLMSLDISNNPSMILGSTIRKGSGRSYDYFEKPRANKIAKEKETLKVLKESPLKLPPIDAEQEVKQEDNRQQDLVFFVEDRESFKLDDLLEASADLRSQSICSSLYKVILKNNVTYDVKRLKKLQVSLEDFSQTMRRIGNLKHRNILPLIGYSCTNEEKLIFYKYQSSGSLLNLLQDHKRNCFFANGYAAPEKSLSEKGDVFSFGVILLELLTGKMVEKTEVDLPKWVKSMVREEWTGEVFDKEVPKTALKWAFPLLNTALKCVSHSPQDRPTAFEKLETLQDQIARALFVDFAGRNIHVKFNKPSTSHNDAE
ncbi:RNA-binding family protein isoform 1 [Hibiscus syriacus]|uniref:RNA-binding family protein isoform 1 n=1 Tax=Hibiscus syriacus TaxID=106335 RepID=A0A6A3CW98_HIBSY|nr:RNA-binding family protein isoform 1 [Hibiscus syriacus]